MLQRMRVPQGSRALPLRSRLVRSVRVVVSRSRLGWRWRLMDFGEQVDTGVEPLAEDARAAGRDAKAKYVSKLVAAENSNAGRVPLISRGRLRRKKSLTP